MISRRKRIRLRRIIRLYGAFLRDFLRALFEPKLEHYAASLSFSTLFSIVPLMAIMISVFTALPQFLQLRVAVERFLRANLPLSDPALVMDTIDRFVANTGQLGLLGVAWMLLAAYFFSRTLDYIVQDVCHAQQRSAWQALATYAGLALAVPVLAAAAYGAQAKLAALTGNLVGSWLLPKLISLLLFWALLWLFYQFAPNRRIAPQAAAISSFIVAFIWLISRDLFLLYATWTPTYATIYGVIATLILFLWWVYISWAILVHGLKFCMLLQRQEEGGREKGTG